MFDPARPGLIIADILQNGDLPIGNSVTKLAKHLGVTRATLSRVIHGKAAISAEMALRLEAALGVKAAMWLRMQSARDIWVVSQKKSVAVTRLVLEKAA